MSKNTFFFGQPIFSQIIGRANGFKNFVVYRIYRILR
jgi:hypothetical protein